MKQRHNAEDIAKSADNRRQQSQDPGDKEFQRWENIQFRFRWETTFSLYCCWKWVCESDRIKCVNINESFQKQIKFYYFNSIIFGSKKFPGNDMLTLLIRFLSHRILCCWRRCIESGWHPGQTDWQDLGLALARNPRSPPNHLKMSWHTPHLLPFPKENVSCFFCGYTLFLLHFRLLTYNLFSQKKLKVNRRQSYISANSFFPKISLMHKSFTTWDKF